MAVQLPVEGQVDWDTTLNNALLYLDDQHIKHDKTDTGTHGVGTGRLASFQGAGRAIYVGASVDTSKMVPGDIWIKIDLGA